MCRRTSTWAACLKMGHVDRGMLIETAGNLRSAHERALAGRIGARHAIVFGYARTALRAILSAVASGRGLDIAGAEVVLSPITCKVVPLTILSLGLKPVYADICADTLNLDPNKVLEATRAATLAVLFQHTYGNPAGLREVASAAGGLGIPLIEDCAQCWPRAEQGSTIGTTGAASIFSNNLMKPMPAGSGGVAITNDERLASALREARNALKEPSPGGEIRRRVEAWIQHHLLTPALYWPSLLLYSQIGSNYQLRDVREEIASDVLGVAHAVTSRQMREGERWLNRVDTLAAHSIQSCAQYAEGLRGSRNFEIPAANERRPLYWFPVLTESKQELLRRARRQLLEIVAWPRSTPIYPLEDPRHLKTYGYESGSCPVAEMVAARLVGLPTHEKISAAHRERIITLLKELR